MKNLIVYFFLLFVTTSMSQTLTLKELLSLHKSPVSEINDYVIAKNWKLNKMEEKGDFKDFNGKIWVGFEASWYFKDNNENQIQKLEYSEFSDYELPENKGKSDVLEMNSIKKVLITYNVLDSKIYFSIKDQLILMGFKKGKEIYGGDAIQVHYELGNYTVKLSVMKKNNEQVYIIHVINNVDYDKVKKK